jgi:hypothetical protein
MSDCIYNGPKPKSINESWEDHSEDFITCLVNGERKKVINSRYLRKIGWSKSEYADKFPGAPLICEQSRLSRSEKTPLRVSVRKQTMIRLNADQDFQIKRVQGVLSFLDSDQSASYREQQSSKAILQHQNGLSDIIKEKYWNQLTDEKRRERNWTTRFTSFEEFVIRAKNIHGDIYEYNEDDYSGSCQKVTIKCPKHGYFKQIGKNHLRGAICGRCSNFSSKMENRWLDTLNIYDRQRYIPLRPHRKRGAIVDGFDEKSNTVYQFHGDFWHGNPSFYDPDDWNPRTDCSYGTLYAATLFLDSLIIKAGYNLIVMWEAEWLANFS